MALNSGLSTGGGLGNDLTNEERIAVLEIDAAALLVEVARLEALDLSPTTIVEQAYAILNPDEDLALQETDNQSIQTWCVPAGVVKVNAGVTMSASSDYSLELLIDGDFAVRATANDSESNDPM